MSNKPTSMRLPDGLLVYLKHQAVDNRRSLTGEIIARLEASRKQEEEIAKAA
jgi:hypothetical protein